jgi:hypothetical protein
MSWKTVDRIRRIALSVGLVCLSGPTAVLAYDAAAAIASANGDACVNARPFYWEIGGASGAPLVSGQVGGTDYGRNTVVALASSSKWPFAAYVVQRYNGPPSGVNGAIIVSGLNMKLGYTYMYDPNCLSVTTVGSCFTTSTNSLVNLQAVGHFFYNSGNAQAVAATPALLHLGAKTNATMLTEVNNYLALGPTFGYIAPTMSSGLHASAADYVTFLQNIMNGTYQISNYLGYSPVATHPCENGLTGCSPFGSVNFHFSLHHWIEDNTGGTYPIHGTTQPPGDGAYSSPGAYGFYPWISANKQYYGVISTQGDVGKYEYTIPCGRAIRGAFLGT